MKILTAFAIMQTILIVVFAVLNFKIQDQNNRILKTVRDWQEVAEQWKNNSNNFEKIANEAIKTAESWQQSCMKN